MKTHTITVYTYEELSPNVQKKVLDRYRDINTDSYWQEPTIWEWKNKLEALGYYSIDVFYTGFGSQGDGACYTADVDIKKWLKAHKLANKYRALYIDDGLHFSISITHHWRYYYSTSTNVEEGYHNDCNNRKLEHQFAEVVELITKEREEIGDKIYKDLNDEYDYQTSDNVIQETLIANEYMFMEDGKKMEITDKTL